MVKLHEEILEKQRQVNGGLTDLELSVKKENDLRMKIADMLTEYAKTLQDGKGGFRDSIANNMLEGYSPRGKAIRITKEILAKIYGGRMGSKSYNEKYENITELFEKVEEIEKDFNS